MKKLMFKLFPILGEDAPPEWIDKENLANRLGVLCMQIGMGIGVLVSLIAFEIVKLITK